ncbi:hypothetical protein [Flavobacterium sp. HJSW_4]|uniref:hypothetical protein n=1 Tax=Flavobacterium sp. HJSW_4 TaxID=3344660 RepID=UPI0035F26609
MSKKKQTAIGKARTNPAEKKAIDNRSNQLNPNNNKYVMSREKSAAKTSAGKDDPSDWNQDSFGDDWEFNDN